MRHARCCGTTCPEAVIVPVDILHIIKSELLQRQGCSQDTPSGSPADEVKQLVDTLASALLQLMQHPDCRQPLQH